MNLTEEPKAKLLELEKELPKLANSKKGYNRIEMNLTGCRK